MKSWLEAGMTPIIADVLARQGEEGQLRKAVQEIRIVSAKIRDQGCNKSPGLGKKAATSTLFFK